MKFFLFFLLLLLFISCDEEHFTPIKLEHKIDPPIVNSSITAIYHRVKQSETPYLRFEDKEDTLWLEGYVSSSDAGGNFYKEVYVQDAPKNPRHAIRILLDQTAVHNYFPLGRKVYIKLNGLGAGFDRGILTIGIYNADGVENLSHHLIDSHLVRSSEDFVIQPITTEVSRFGNEEVGKWIMLEGVQFSNAELGRTFAGQAFDQFDGERRLLHCQSHHNVWVSTSTFSKFKSVVIPDKRGNLTGILTRDYYDQKYIIKINSPDDLNFEDSRCDPFFEEHFETAPKGKLEIEGWLNYTEEGSPYWKIAEEETTLGRSASISAYASNDTNSVVWLVSPEIDLSNLSQPYFFFRTAVKYGDKSNLEVFISTNFKGSLQSVKQAFWQKLDLKIASRMDGNEIWIDSGRFNLKDFYNEIVHFGFRYTGSGKTTYDATFFLDDVTVQEQ